MDRQEVMNVVKEACDQLRPHREEQLAERALLVLLGLWGALKEGSERELAAEAFAFSERRLLTLSAENN